jgi:hypothetical protein
MDASRTTLGGNILTDSPVVAPLALAACLSYLRLCFVFGASVGVPRVHAALPPDFDKDIYRLISPSRTAHLHLPGTGNTFAMSASNDAAETHRPSSIPGPEAAQRLSTPPIVVVTCLHDDAGLG